VERVRVIVDVQDFLHYCTLSKLGLDSIHGIVELSGVFGHQHGLDCLHELARLIENEGLQIFRPHIDEVHFLTIVREYYFLCKSAEIEENVRALICRDLCYIKRLTEHLCTSDTYPHCFANHIEMCVQVAMYVNPQSARILLSSDFCEVVISMFYSPYAHITSLAIETMKLIVVAGQRIWKLLGKHVCSITMGLDLAISYVLILYARNGMGTKRSCVCGRNSSELDVFEECITKLYQVCKFFFDIWYLWGTHSVVYKKTKYNVHYNNSTSCVICSVVHSNIAQCGSALRFFSSLCS